MAYDSATGRPLSPDEEALRRRNASLVYGPPEVETIPADLTADDFLGGPDLDTTQEAAFDPGRFGGVIEGLAGLNTATRAPRNFGEGLIGGFSRGLGAAGTRVSEARQRFERGAAARQAARDEDNRQATKDYRERLARQRERAPGEKRAADKDARDAAKEARDAAEAERGRLENTPGTPQYDAMLKREGAVAGARRAPEKPAGPAYDLKDVSSFNTAVRSDPAIKTFQDVSDGYRRVRTGSRLATAQGDISLIFGFMKMNDPGSTVREGEYATAENSRGVPEQVRAQYNKMLRGEKLSPEQREGFRATAEALYNEAKIPADRALALYGAQADAFKVPRELLFRDYGVEAEGPPLPASVRQQAAPSDYVPRPGKTRIVNGKLVRVN